MSIPTFSPGQAAIVRNVLDGRVRWAAPMRVVRDDGDFVALFLDIGTHYQTEADSEGKQTRDFVHATGNVEQVWGRHRALWLVRFGDHHATVPMWNEAGTFVGWYVNFQEPLRRTADGFETMDLVFDMLIGPDLRWSWKDEDEFEDGIRAGWFTTEQLDDLKARGMAILEAARAGEPPFGDGWQDWKPDPTWPVPELPANWAVPTG